MPRSPKLKKIQLTGTRVRELLDKRFTSAFHNPLQNGFYWRADRFVCGLNLFGGRLGDDQVVDVPHGDEASFLEAVFHVRRSWA